PRFISRSLIASGGGAQLLLFGDSTRAGSVPNTAAVSDGRFSLRCMLSPRHGHMLNEVAIEYTPLGVFRCFAFRDVPPPFGRDDIRDITPLCRMFYNARDRYVEAYGVFRPPDRSGWKVIAFFHASSSHADYSNRNQMRGYAARLAVLRNAGIQAGSLMWDEAGYTCTYGSLPFTPAIRRAFRRDAGFALEGQIWKLAFEAADGSHIPLRVRYYRAVQKSVNDAQRFSNRAMRRLWGPGTVASVHDTWHFESADMCDMNHGSMDLWTAAKVKSGGFVDLGGVNVLRDPASPYYANLAALSVIAASLGRHSRETFAFNNLWTVGDDGGAGWQREVMDHCVDVLALFGLRWLAHAYGPVGTIGEENTFLGSPPLPGYPRHSTWPGFPAWNDRLRAHAAATGGALPSANVLLLFPVEALYALADRRADVAAQAVFDLILGLVDAQYQVDVIATSEAAAGSWKGKNFLIGKNSYEAVILPFARVMERALLSRLLPHQERLLWYGGMPFQDIRGREFEFSAGSASSSPGELVKRLESLHVKRPVRGPEGTWVTAATTRGGIVASAVPSRLGFSAAGILECGDFRATLPPSTGLSRICFPLPGGHHAD
ncbi:MAG TPA: hypothetical protein VK569_10460, partial [Bacteroidota bacterium]|nr:hypothetical protein [Bacteroidota bacterium]